MRSAFVGAGLAVLALPGEVALHWSLWAIAGMSVLAGLVGSAAASRD